MTLLGWLIILAYLVLVMVTTVGLNPATLAVLVGVICLSRILKRERI